MIGHKEKYDPFLGITNHRKMVGHCLVVLNSYGTAPEQEEWHSHQNTSLSFLLSGTHDEEISGTRYNRVPGDIKIIFSGTRHRCNNYVPGTRKINLDLTAGVLHHLGITETKLEQLVKPPLQAKLTLLKLYREFLVDETHGTAPAELLLYELFNPAPAFRKEPGKLPAWAKQLMLILNDEWNKPFDLQYLADQVGVHPVTISRYFPYYFSQTLGQYLNRLKIERSLPLIKQGKYSLTAIAYECGFSDQSHFTRVFQAVTGFLPSQFRRI